MSGTAADNHPQDLWSILNWLWPTVYTSYWKFYEHHLEYEVAYQGGQGYRKVKGVKNVDELHAFLEGKYRRRLKRDPAIALELPDKYYTRMYVPLSPQQRRAYDEMKSDFIAWVSTKKKESKGDELTPLMAQAVVAQLVRLQQLGVAYPGDIEEIRVWNKALAEKYNLVKPDPRGYEIRQKVVLTDPSSKIDTVLQILEDAPDDKQFVIFSQYRGAIDLLGARLAARGITHFALTGNTPQSERDQGVEDFQHSKTRCVIGTIKAGGVGITLHASSTVIFLDRDWSPSVNRQAEDRVDRIGQKHNVQIIDLIAPNTVDLGRHQRIDKKWSWIEKMLGDPESIRNMSEE
jgi:SNF2 family DNA or RNA helicase